MAESVLKLQDGWRIAIEREVEAHAFYMQLASLAEDETTKKLFEFLAGEEVKHQDRLRREYENYFQTDM
jgi:rubrerythrin